MGRDEQRGGRRGGGGGGGRLRRGEEEPEESIVGEMPPPPQGLAADHSARWFATRGEEGVSEVEWRRRRIPFWLFQSEVVNKSTPFFKVLHPSLNV